MSDFSVLNSSDEVIATVRKESVSRMKLIPGLRLVPSSQIPVKKVTREELVQEIGVANLKRVLSDTTSPLFPETILLLTQQSHTKDDPDVKKLVEDIKANKKR